MALQCSKTHNVECWHSRNIFYSTIIIQEFHHNNVNYVWSKINQQNMCAYNPKHNINQQSIYRKILMHTSKKILQYKHNPNTREYKYNTNNLQTHRLPNLHFNADIHFFFISIQHPILALKWSSKSHIFYDKLLCLFFCSDIILKLLYFGLVLNFSFFIFYLYKVNIITRET